MRFNLKKINKIGLKKSEKDKKKDKMTDFYSIFLTFDLKGNLNKERLNCK